LVNSDAGVCVVFEVIDNLRRGALPVRIIVSARETCDRISVISWGPERPAVRRALSERHPSRMARGDGTSDNPSLSVLDVHRVN